MIKKITKTVLKHKVIFSALVPLLAVGGYLGVNTLKGNTVETRYVLAAAQKETLINSVSGSGQISVSDQLDIKPKVSGDVINVGVEAGQEVKAGTLLVQIDNKDAEKAVNNARTDLETAQLNLNKLTAPPSDLDVLKAENDLTTAQNSLNELTNPDESTLSQAESALTAAEDSLTKLRFSQESDRQNSLDSKQTAQDNLDKAHDDAFNSITNAFLNLPTIMTNLDDILNSYEISLSESSIGGGQVINSDALMNSTDLSYRDDLQTFQTRAENDYEAARSKYDANFDHYTNTDRYSDEATIESLLTETSETVKTIAQLAKRESNYLDVWADYRTRAHLNIFSKVKDYQTTLGTYIGQINSYSSSLLSAQKSLADNSKAVTNAERDLEEMNQNQPIDLATAERTVQEKEDALSKLKNPDAHDVQTAQIAVKEKELALNDLKAGADALDIRAEKITIQQKADALLSAQQNLADYKVQIPFDGVIAKLDVKKSDTVSSGTALATLVTKQRIAEISLNEVDAAKVKAGQKVTLTFDAVSDLSITGEVAEIDTLGTVTQGVVTYNVKIIFDTQDDRVKPGMSVSASIITDVKSNVLTVPNAAVKSSGAGSYVELPDETIDQTAATSPSGVILTKPLREQPVEVGEANDSSTEITSGLNEGDLVLVRTITPTTSTAAKTQSNSLLGGSTGGAVRINNGFSGGGMPRGD